MSNERIKIVRTNSENKDFIELIKDLDAYLKITDGSEHDFYNQFNKIDKINCVVVIYLGEEAVACGAIKPHGTTAMEVKRMYTAPASRGHGMATLILQELENWARELACTRCLLETGKRQPEAIGLYEKNGYRVIANYGQYQGRDNSVCFAKEL